LTKQQLAASITVNIHGIDQIKSRRDVQVLAIGHVGKSFVKLAIEIVPSYYSHVILKIGPGCLRDFRHAGLRRQNQDGLVAVGKIEYSQLHILEGGLRTFASERLAWTGGTPG
jgi:hypothetical protein